MENPQNKPLNEWHEEEERVPVEVPTFSLDDHNNLTYEGLTKTEKVVKKKVAYTQLVPRTCPNGEHFYTFYNGGLRVNGRVEVQCRDCSMGIDFVVGLFKLVNGKVQLSSF